MSNQTFFQLHYSKTICLSLFFLFFTLTYGWANPTEHSSSLPDDLTELSFETLMNIQVTSVSKKAEKMFEAASSVYVLTQEDIRRSGIMTVPELFRFVPGMQVAKLDGSKWAISSRGFNGQFSNKLLVLIDGRSVYSPLFGGVYWDEQDLVLEDIDRIEVIRGPGGTLWGANAVNGVINITTKHASETQGGYLRSAAGNEERGLGSFRYGGSAGENAHYRVYGKYFSRDDSVDMSGNNIADGWEAVRGGFRVDWKATESNSLTFQGDVYNGEAFRFSKNRVISLTAPTTATFIDKERTSGGNFLAKWEKQLSSQSSFALQFYFNQERRVSPGTGGFTLDTYDIDFQHHLSATENHDIVWGLGQRYISDKFGSTFDTSYTETRDFTYVISGFLQDEITLIPNRLKLTLGSKFEENEYTGFEFQPSGRLAWTPDKNQTIWAAISRAVQTPTRSQETVRFNSSVVTGPTVVSVFGSENIGSSDLLAFELGYRVRPMQNLFIDIAAYYNFYEDIVTREIGSTFAESSPAPSHFVVPITLENKADS
jgi:iron complex outermembrane receptor protein